MVKVCREAKLSPKHTEQDAASAGLPPLCYFIASYYYACKWVSPGILLAQEIFTGL